MIFLITFPLLVTLKPFAEKKQRFPPPPPPRSACVCVLDTPNVSSIKIRINLRTRFRRSSCGKYGRNSKGDVGRLTSLRYVFLAFGSWLAAFITRGGNLPMLYDSESLYSNSQATGPLLHKVEILVLSQQGIRLVERTRCCDKETFVRQRAMSLAVDRAQWNLS